MTPHLFIDTLLEKYQQAPSYPFHDWVENPVSFYALINLWDDIFKAAAGKVALEFVAANELKQDPDSKVYSVVHDGMSRIMHVSHDAEGGLFFLAESQPSPDEDAPLDRLEIISDISRPQLLASFQMLREFARADLSAPDARSALEQDFVIRFKSAFGYPDFDPFQGPSIDGNDDVDHSGSEEA
ncbi:hypothetical protein [uncultured Litoreibacter sp.]|uniref:hypothetical protein n=1 Tax=uncultured Litoreibacter sp. TaxID=1392394 RepID=UPI002635BC9E|nr:hypothetical protein [uncultured Litoreibacter sp.]